MRYVLLRTKSPNRETVSFTVDTDKELAALDILMRFLSTKNPKRAGFWVNYFYETYHEARVYKKDGEKYIKMQVVELKKM